jgi:hypothetical protein
MTEKTSTNKHRYDVVYDVNGPILTFHFCREWDENGGCYGTNPDHGFTFEEAKEIVLEHYSSLLNQWKEMSEEEWLNENTVDPEEATDQL